MFVFILIHDCINLDYEWNSLLRKSFFKVHSKIDLNFCHQKIILLNITKQILIFIIKNPSFFTSHKTDLYFDKQKSIFFNNKNRSDFFKQKKRFHQYINLCNLIFYSHVQHIMHDMHNIVHWWQESRRPDFVWAEWVPNTFPFRNLASGFRFLV